MRTGTIRAWKTKHVSARWNDEAHGQQPQGILETNDQIVHNRNINYGPYGAVVQSKTHEQHPHGKRNWADGRTTPKNDAQDAHVHVHENDGQKRAAENPAEDLPSSWTTYSRPHGGQSRRT